MKLIVGLGNPGRKYEKTRHNVGFEVVERLAEPFGQAAARDKFDGRAMDAAIAGERVVLLCPHTYMNRSGSSVRSAVGFYKLELAKILIVCDDFNLPLGKLRFRARGSAGGNNGLEDIISQLGSEEFSRLRIGIGPVPERWDSADFVLGRFSAAERGVIDQATAQAAEAAQYWVSEGIAVAMNQFN